MTYAVTKNRMETLKEKFEQCSKLDAKLHASADSKEKTTHPYFSDHEFDECEEAYETALDYFAEVVHELSKSSVHPAANVSHLHECQSHTTLNLPKVTLPVFDGSFDKWESFRDRFQSMIIEEKSLSNVQKLHHLFSCLKGEALTAIEHLTITSDNFAVAWTILSSNFENERRLINSYIHRLFTLPNVTAKSATELRALQSKLTAAIAALKNLSRPVEHWSDIFVYIITQRLDKSSREAWELKLGKTTVYPTFDEISAFLDSRIRALDALVPIASTLDKQSDKSNAKLKQRAVTSHTTSATKLSCPVCESNHLLYQCTAFLGKTPTQRYEIIRNGKRCLNCLSSKHQAKECPSTRSCKECHKRHHTLLHFFDAPKSAVQASSSPASTNPVISTSDVSSHIVAKAVTARHILLATARVRVHSMHGRFQWARALIDQGSASSFITENLVQSLRLPKLNTAVRVTGIGETQTNVRHAVHLTITPSNADTPVYRTTALILKSLTRYLPNRLDIPEQWPHLNGLSLADPDPAGSDPIEIIIGADLFGSLILDGVRKGAVDEPIAQNTALGWIISGPIAQLRPLSQSSIGVHHCSVTDDLNQTLRRFWEIEEIPASSKITSEEKACDDHFNSTHSRNSEGRYIVRLPFKHGPPLNIGESRHSALQSYLRTESRIKTDSSKSSEYHNFLKEYYDLRHMQRVSETEQLIDSNQIVYIPHHAVFRANSLTTRIRIVFNASSRTSNGTSLNDHLYPGPKLQKDLAAVILRWRTFRYVYSADVAKMYRQIQVDPRDRDFQRIFWRPSPTHQVEEYRLCTVTYGMTSAPYLALKVMNQLAIDEGASFPLATSVIDRQMYVDDFIFGADDKVLARQTREQIVSLLKRGGFTLRKWASNVSELLDEIEDTDHGLAQSRDLNEDESLKILGLTWQPDRDIFKFTITITGPPGNTKRRILSDIAKFFDPLGWATPVIIRAKILMQRLWIAKCEWDEVAPPNLLEAWQQYHTHLKHLEEVMIPRWIQLGHHVLHLELHGFSDASTKAYAAAVYIRVVTVDGMVSVNLLAAKSKVAPVKVMSVPRLELSAAQLLARLIHFIREALDFREVNVYCWTDSTITLAWMSRPSTTWKTFIANRVADIHTLLPDIPWRHVPTKENPADCASRGISPDDLATNLQWWSGPDWLIKSSDYWPKSDSDFDPHALSEQRAQPQSLTTSVVASWDLSQRYSSWHKLLQITAYIYRFVTNSRSRHINLNLKIQNPRAPIYLNPIEIKSAEIFWIRYIQSELFHSEISALSTATPIKKSSTLLSLNPYLDNDQIIRVGGRLRNATLQSAVRNPIVLKDHALVRMIIMDTHRRMLHAGSQLTLARIREKFWILRARSLVRAVLYKCVSCTRERAQIPNELMGDLPNVRVNRSARAFEHAGVDYAGPILVRTSRGRGHKAHKAYIAVFVCMTTKAIHLELVSDYSSDAFLATLNRFVSRRGYPASIYSDNGTTFQGADRELKLAIAQALKNSDLQNTLSTDGINWHFVPPSAPHFGGLWEAAVRSVKYHLKRCIGSHTLTFEELNTVLCRIEACLNSRPIGSVSENLDDYHVLTPGHFLIGGPILAAPQPSVLDLNETRLSRWQLLQHITEKFWKSWSNDYLLTLQQRPKWKIAQRLATVGRIVLLRNALAPPSHWELGRIIECHPGNDGLVRVVTVRTARSQYKRPIVKLCFLPIDINTSSDQSSGMAGGTDSD
ncbi:uncharacterized protein LOC114941332 [Nylanderia fulva]|nr:uncharacterized protein LOC114941332 [Nylanderia fulva]